MDGWEIVVGGSCFRFRFDSRISYFWRRGFEIWLGLAVGLRFAGFVSHVEGFSDFLLLKQESIFMKRRQNIPIHACDRQSSRGSLCISSVQPSDIRSIDIRTFSGADTRFFVSRESIRPRQPPLPSPDKPIPFGPTSFKTCRMKTYESPFHIRSISSKSLICVLQQNSFSVRGSLKVRARRNFLLCVFRLPRMIHCQLSRCETLYCRLSFGRGIS
ncbi:hypothetical protein BKA64DRAFT_397669 [Cadophora sp. MPI-SDFR-AT-0126]|nr:hypothetical protein BKA64DRAFT_397669 [Leotiomycetes sp. MPI-SDFR-AT-0126]